MTMVTEFGRNLAFIVGVPRSGTTLLSVMLGNHPEVLCPPEPWVMLAVASLGRVAADHPADPQLLGQCFAEFCGTHDGTAASRSYARELYNRKLAEARRSLFIDKTPRYYLILPYLRRIFPEAKFICVFRNPLDVAASYKTTWGVDVPKQLLLCLGSRACIDLVWGSRTLREFAAAEPERATIVSYESLVCAPDTVLARLLSFLGLAPSPGLSDFDVSTGSFARALAGDKAITATRRPHQCSIGKWRSAFSKEDLSVLVSAVGADLFNELGYEATVRELLSLPVRIASAAESVRCLARVQNELDRRQGATIHPAESDATLGLTSPLADELDLLRADLAAEQDRVAQLRILTRQQARELEELRRDLLTARTSPFAGILQLLRSLRRTRHGRPPSVP